MRCLCLLAAGFLTVACSSSSSSDGADRKLCVEDVECPTGHGCFRGMDKVSYCAPLCTNDSQCPDRISCPSNQPTKDDKSCEETGKHKNQGVCSLYASPEFDSTNCGSAVFACKSEDNACSCTLGTTPGTLAQCDWSMYSGICCADEGYPASGSCFCSPVTSVSCSELGMSSAIRCMWKI